MLTTAILFLVIAILANYCLTIKIKEGMPKWLVAICGFFLSLCYLSVLLFVYAHFLIFPI